MAAKAELSAALFYFALLGDGAEEHSKSTDI